MLDKLNKITILKSQESDSKKIWEWRNDADTRNMSRNKKYISWKVHNAWFTEKIASKNFYLYILSINDEQFGVSRFEQNANNKEIFEISINLNPDFRGRNLGKYVLEKSSKTLPKTF